MTPPILSLHLVTATVDDPQADLDFCLEALGLRLVKKTVNFDNHHVYHFYYGDQCGTPGTIWTTFPYKNRGVPVGKKGAGQITVTSFSVPAGALDRWKARLRRRGGDRRGGPPGLGAGGRRGGGRGAALWRSVDRCLRSVGPGLRAGRHRSRRAGAVAVR